MSQIFFESLDRLERLAFIMGIEESIKQCTPDLADGASCITALEDLQQHYESIHLDMCARRRNRHDDI